MIIFFNQTFLKPLAKFHSNPLTRMVTENNDFGSSFIFISLVSIILFLTKIDYSLFFQNFEGKTKTKIFLLVFNLSMLFFLAFVRNVYKPGLLLIWIGIFLIINIDPDIEKSFVIRDIWTYEVLQVQFNYNKVFQGFCLIVDVVFFLVFLSKVLATKAIFLVFIIFLSRDIAVYCSKNPVNRVKINALLIVLSVILSNLDMVFDFTKDKDKIYMFCPRFVYDYFPWLASSDMELFTPNSDSEKVLMILSDFADVIFNLVFIIKIYINYKNVVHDYYVFLSYEKSENTPPHGLII